jgi:CRP-like cAMP-binding protein
MLVGILPVLLEPAATKTGDEMNVIVSDEVRVLALQEDQEEKEIALLWVAGDLEGELSGLSGDTRCASVAVVGDVRILYLDRLSFKVCFVNVPRRS